MCIDLKSFYASVECVERGLDPMKTKLVVADRERSDKTICLAVSPAMKALGVKNRCRLFEIPRNIDYITATPRMQKYIDYSAEIYGIYLRWFSKEDIHVYSIDEAFIDVTHYLAVYGKNPESLAEDIIADVRKRSGITATCGIGTNLYLAKIALDITAKHAANYIGVLDEEAYRRQLWNHRPLTDFWRFGRGIAARLEKIGIYTMGDIAHADEELIYDIFGVDGELIIDHAWGRETTTMADIKAYRPQASSMTSGQVLMRDYSFDEGRTIIKEMTDKLCLDLASRNKVAGSITISVGYGGISWQKRQQMSRGEKRAGGRANFPGGTNSPSLIVREAVALYDSKVDRKRTVRRMNISLNDVREDDGTRQISLFDGARLESNGKERRIQQAQLAIKEKYGKNAIFKGVNMHPESTGRERNRQIGGHKSGEE